MKQLICLGLLMCGLSSIHAQTSEDVGKIALSVIMPENVDGLDDSQLSKLQSKLMQITSDAGFAGVGYNHNFVIYPKFAVYDISTVESGMRNITIATTEVSLFIKQIDNNVLFSSVSKELKGSGKNRDAAITNAISKINVTDPQFRAFINKGKAQILRYYELKCLDIIQKAESLGKMQDYEQALGLLMAVPDAASCYKDVLDKGVETFIAYQNQHCKEMIQGAQAALEANDYRQSLTMLSRIDPSSDCAKESLAMMKSAGAKVDVYDKKEWDFAMRVYSDDVALEKMRINAIKEIASSYYRNQPKTMNYLYIIK